VVDRVHGVTARPARVEVLTRLSGFWQGVLAPRRTPNPRHQPPEAPGASRGRELPLYMPRGPRRRPLTPSQRCQCPEPRQGSFVRVRTTDFERERSLRIEALERGDRPVNPWYAMRIGGRPLQRYCRSCRPVPEAEFTLVDVLIWTNSCVVCCESPAAFAPEGARPLRCGRDREDGDVDRQSRRCAWEGCKEIAHWGKTNREGEPFRREWCGQHKEDGMVCGSRRCVVEGCGRAAIGGRVASGTGLTHCQTHGPDVFGQEFSMSPSRRCSRRGCKELARVWRRDDKGRGLGLRTYEPPVRVLCVSHHAELPEDEQEAYVRPEDIACKGRCEQLYQEHELVEGLCMLCRPAAAGDSGNGNGTGANDKVRGSKEQAVMAYLRGDGRTSEMMAWAARSGRIRFDATIPPEQTCNNAAGGGRYRPDLHIEFDTWRLVVEVDEHSHESYDTRCELVRMTDIGNQPGEPKPTAFVRFNPDKFRGRDGVARRVPMRRRLDRLAETIAALVGESERQGGAPPQAVEAAARASPHALGVHTIWLFYSAPVLEARIQDAGQLRGAPPTQPQDFGEVTSFMVGCVVGLCSPRHAYSGT